MYGMIFIISNLGSFGIEYFIFVLNIFEIGILGIGVIEYVFVYKGKKLKKGSMLFLSLIFDYCVLDGVLVVVFLCIIKYYLEEFIIIFL